MNKKKYRIMLRMYRKLQRLQRKVNYQKWLKKINYFDEIPQGINTAIESLKLQLGI